ncbi:MAG: hypothetical protein IPL28_22450 [Chloroflexi bacterium]|nr:hypothetical protein [Chloroflexota bacterium]
MRVGLWLGVLEVPVGAGRNCHKCHISKLVAVKMSVPPVMIKPALTSGMPTIRVSSPPLSRSHIGHEKAGRGR